jgi:hypothetical protein
MGERNFEKGKVGEEKKFNKIINLTLLDFSRIEPCTSLVYGIIHFKKNCCLQPIFAA